MGWQLFPLLVLGVLKPGDKILTHYFFMAAPMSCFTKYWNLGYRGCDSDLRDLNIAEEYIRKDKTIKMIHPETPANPTIQCVDIAAITTLAKGHGIKVAVDNTFYSIPATTFSV